MSWKELADIDPRAVTIQTAPAMIAKRKSDPWEELLTTRQALPEALIRD